MTVHAVKLALRRVLAQVEVAPVRPGEVRRVVYDVRALAFAKLIKA